MNRTPTWRHWTAFSCLIAGIVCIVVAAITSAIIAVGSTIHWMIPSLPFGSACTVAGIACACTGILFRGAAKSIFEAGIKNHLAFDEEDDDEDEDDDDYIFDEEMADRIAELTVAKLTRPVTDKKYTAKAPARRK